MNQDQQQTLQLPVATVNINKLSEMFKLLSNATRIQILSLLSGSEHSVDSLAKCLNLSQSVVSHHLKDLRIAGLVRGHKSGRSVFYNLRSKYVCAFIGGRMENLVKQAAVTEHN